MKLNSCLLRISQNLEYTNGHINLPERFPSSFHHGVLPSPPPPFHRLIISSRIFYWVLWETPIQRVCVLARGKGWDAGAEGSTGHRAGTHRTWVCFGSKGPNFQEASLRNWWVLFYCCLLWLAAGCWGCSAPPKTGWAMSLSPNPWDHKEVMWEL